MNGKTFEGERETVERRLFFTPSPILVLRRVSTPASVPWKARSSASGSRDEPTYVYSKYRTESLLCQSDVATGRPIPLTSLIVVLLANYLSENSKNCPKKVTTLLNHLVVRARECTHTHTGAQHLPTTLANTHGHVTFRSIAF